MSSSLIFSNKKSKTIHTFKNSSKSKRKRKRRISNMNSSNSRRNNSNSRRNNSRFKLALNKSKNNQMWTTHHC